MIVVRMTTDYTFEYKTNFMQKLVALSTKTSSFSRIQ